MGRQPRGHQGAPTPPPSSLLQGCVMTKFGIDPALHGLSYLIDDKEPQVQGGDVVPIARRARAAPAAGSHVAKTLSRSDDTSSSPQARATALRARHPRTANEDVPRSPKGRPAAAGSTPGRWVWVPDAILDGNDLTGSDSLGSRARSAPKRRRRVAARQVHGTRRTKRARRR